LAYGLDGSGIGGCCGDEQRRHAKGNRQAELASMEEGSSSRLAAIP